MNTDDTDPVVGHKTYRDGPLGFRHEPLRASEADAIMAAVEAADKRRAELMPDEQAAIRMMFEARQRLIELGWNDATYCPKDGSEFDAIEPGSTGIHRCHYSGEWPNGHWWIVGDGDLYPSRPVLYRAGPPKQPRKRRPPLQQPVPDSQPLLPPDSKTPNARLTGPQRVAHNCNEERDHG